MHGKFQTSSLAQTFSMKAAYFLVQKPPGPSDLPLIVPFQESMPSSEILLFQQQNTRQNLN